MLSLTAIIRARPGRRARRPASRLPARRANERDIGYHFSRSTRTDGVPDLRGFATRRDGGAQRSAALDAFVAATRDVLRGDRDPQGGGAVGEKLSKLLA